jgi:membrane fusion protein, macrolide-specific efflux system
MKKLVAILTLALLAFGGWRWYSKKQAAAVPAYSAITVERGTLTRSVQSNGVVEPRTRLELRPPLAGRLEQVLVREGDYVKRGQTLAWISSSERAALLDAARAKGPEELAKWEQLYKPTPLLAPISGDVIARGFEPGQSVGASDAVLVLSDRLIVKAQLDETDIARVQSGMDARIRLDAYSADALDARVGHIAYEARTVNNVTLYDVDVAPDKVPRFMRAGMSASVDFIQDEREDVLLLPAQAVQRSGRREGVVMVPGPGPQGAAKPVSRTVKLGLMTAEQVEIESGLEEGDTVLQSSAQLPRAEAMGSNPFAPQRQQRVPGQGGGNRGNRNR